MLCGAFFKCYDGISIIGRNYERKNFGGAEKKLVELGNSAGK
jgi:hypothetical protein